MQFSLEGINTVRMRLKSGAIAEYHYCRATGKRIIGEPGTVEFLASYNAARFAAESVPTPQGGTIASLLRMYQSSSEFKAKAKNTKRLYSSYINIANQRFGKMSLKAWEHRSIKSDVFEWRDDIIDQGKEATARNAVKFLQTLFSWAYERGLVEVNHLSKIKHTYNPDRSEILWSAEEIHAICYGARPALALAVCFALSTGQRIGDLTAWNWDSLSGETLKLIQRKTGAFVGLPVLGGFKSLLEAAPQLSHTILANKKKRPWEISSLRQAWRSRLGELGMEENGKRFHDLRGTVITTLADVGATEAQIAAVSGHSYNGQVPTLARYKAKTRAQAEAAMRLLDGSWIGKLQNETAKRLSSY